MPVMPAMDWDAELANVAPDTEHHEWSWRSDDGLWYADDMLDGLMVFSLVEIADWPDADRARAHETRSKWPAVAALVDARMRCPCQ